LPRSALYTTDASFAANTLNNKAFSDQGKAQLETAAGRTINDFRQGTFLFSLRYTIKFIDKGEE